MNTESAVSKIWRLCHVLRGDGVSYHEYISELTYLLFLKIAEETRAEEFLPEGNRWRNLRDYKGDSLLNFYREMLTFLGGHSTSEVVRNIYAFPTTVFAHSENLRAVIDGIDKLDWYSITMDRMGDIYEGLLSKNSQDARSGAGQYFTPRPLVDCIVKLVQPGLGEIIQDPATGTGGFLISAAQYIRSRSSVEAYNRNAPRYEGVEIEKGTYRICLMNAFLHQLDSHIILGDALTKDAEKLSPADVVLANPPFGAKAGSARKQRDDIPIKTANKQLAFLQHIFLGLKAGGRAAVIMPDNVLSENGAGGKIRQILMELCNLHTILRLPAGIFYSHGVKTNVLFFTRGHSDIGNTTNVWVYDMRVDAAPYGKKRPLRPEDFASFESAFGDDPNGLAVREPDLKGGKWRCLSRDTIQNNFEKLDPPELNTAEAAQDAATEVEEIMGAILAHLRAALSEIEAISEEISDSPEVEE